MFDIRKKIYRSTVNDYTISILLYDNGVATLLGNVKKTGFWEILKKKTWKNLELRTKIFKKPGKPVISNNL